MALLLGYVQGLDYAEIASRRRTNKCHTCLNHWIGQPSYYTGRFDSYYMRIADFV
jgi:hypothetical protein